MVDDEVGPTLDLHTYIHINNITRWTSQNMVNKVQRDKNNKKLPP